MADRPTAQFQGSGGAIWIFDLPMVEPLRNQIANGDLRPIDEAARDYALSLNETPGMRTPAKTEKQPAPEPTPEPAAEPEPEVDEGSLPRPPEAGPGSSRKAWAAYAADQGVDVDDDDTRDDIIAKLNG